MILSASGLLCNCCWVLLGFVQNQNGQALDLKPPHEFLSQEDEYQATELTPLRSWELRDGKEFKGKLLKWSNVDGVILFRDQFNRPAYYPSRQFAEADQAELTGLLESTVKEIKYLRSLLPLPVTVDLQPSSGQIPFGSLPLDYRDGFIYWINSGQYFRSPESLFEAAPLAQLSKVVKRMANYQAWDLQSSPQPIRAQLIGIAEDALVMKGVYYSGKMIEDIEYLVPLTFLVEEDQERANKLLATMPNGGRIANEKAPTWWIGFELFLNGPKRPTAIEGAQLKVVQPDFREVVNSPAGSKWVSKSMESQVPMQMLTGEGALFVRTLLEKERLLKENPQLAKSELDKRIASFRSAIIDAKPIEQLSPLKNWHFRECRNGIDFAARVVAERGDYFIFKSDHSQDTFWVRKSEVPQRLQSYCSATAKKLAEYFATHPGVQPKLESKFRLVRTYETGGMQNVGEPVQIPPTGRIELLGLPINGQSGKLMLDPERMHYVDLLELKMVMKGTSPTLDSPPMSESDRRSRDLTERLRSLEERIDVWRIESIMENWGAVGFRGAVIRRYHDSVVLRDGNKDFLVDLDLLANDERARVEKTIKRLDEIRAAANIKNDINATPPQARLWGAISTPMIGSNPQFKPDGSLTYTDLLGGETTVAGKDLPPKLIAEIRMQIEADKQVRSLKGELNADELQQLTELKQRLRKQLLELAMATAMKHFSLKGSVVAASGTFEQFDGEDAIMRDPQGSFVRVFRFALRDESIAAMTKIEQDLKAQGKTSQTPGLNPADVTLRLFRGAKASAFLPGTPIRFDSRNLYVQYASGGFGRHAVDSIHPEDMAAIRSNLYLAANGLKRDTGINERLKQPVKPEEVIVATAELAGKWKQRLDALAEPRAVVWDKKKIDPGVASDVLAVSPDGSHLLVVAPHLLVLNLADNKGVRIECNAKALSPAFIANENQTLIGFDGENMKRWDLKTGKMVDQFDAIDQAPIAWCQSADGQRLLMLADAKQLFIIDMKSDELQCIRFGDDSQLAARPALWCSANGDRLIARAGKSLQVFVWDKQKATYKADYPIECPYENVLVAFGMNFIVIGDQKNVNVAAVGRANGNFSISEIGTGIQSEWMGVEEVDGEELLHVIGKRGDPLSQAAPYLFSAYIGLDRRVARTAQSIDVPIGSKTLFAESGRTVIVRSNDGLEVVTSGPLSEGQFKPLDGIARELIDETDVGQIDAAWEYLRSVAFQRLGEYPDQASEMFLEYMGLHVANHKWQHGGDMKERADLLLDRWRKVAPKSMFVPALTAIHQRRLAWEARGTGFANTVTAEGAKVFEQKMLAVAALLKPIFQLDHPPTRAYSIAYDVAMSLGLPTEVTKNLNASMMKTPIRSSTPAHAAVVLSLLPRWHGEPGDSERYITAIANKLGGDEGDCMYANLMLYAANYYPSDESASNYLEYDPKRVLKGLQVFYRMPQSAENFQRALKMFAGEERWDLYKQALELRTEERIFQDDTTIKTLEMHVEQEQRALGAK